jgi:hypothetical protein
LEKPLFFPLSSRYGRIACGFIQGRERRKLLNKRSRIDRNNAALNLPEFGAAMPYVQELGTARFAELKGMAVVLLRFF